jgi:undecaprenyl-diphosphatase
MPLWLGWAEGARAALHMVVVGAVGLALYKVLKRTLVRERPFVGLVGIECAMPPLDRYSFPSGHTLHAVAFTVLAVGYVPWLAALLVPFALLVAASRVVLGLHYPSDVAVGALLGVALASASFALVG